jgi:ADP-ribose pyrophosphatase
MDLEDEEQVFAEGKFVRLVRRGRWEWAQRTNCSHAVVIAAVTLDRHLVLIDQYRVPLGARVIELPAGLVGDDAGKEQEPPLHAARRELLEETGYEAPRWEALLDGPSSPGMTDESYTLFLARGARQVAPGGGEPEEDIRVHAVPLGQVEAWAEAKRAAGTIVDPKIYTGLYFAMKGE